MEYMTPLIQKLDAIWIGFIKLLPQIGFSFVILLVTWLVANSLRRAVRSVMRRSNVRMSLQRLVATLVQILVWVGGVLIAVTILFPSLTPAKLLAALGIGSIAVGLAFKDIFENFLAGVMIMLRKPMRIGDFIECNDLVGKVEDITIRDTYIRKTDDQLIMVPNAYLYKNPVFVLTDMDLRRFEIICGVTYDTPLEEAQNVIRQALDGIEGIDVSKGVDVFAREFNASSIDFTVRWWAKSTPLGMHESRDRVVRAIKAGLDAAQIEIPFPHRTLTFNEPVKFAGDDTQEKPKQPEAEAGT